MHSGGKGIAKSSLPYKRTPPSWLKMTASQVEETVCKFAKKGLTPSQVSNLYFSHSKVVISYLTSYYTYAVDWCHFKRLKRCRSSKERHW